MLDSTYFSVQNRSRKVCFDFKAPVLVHCKFNEVVDVGGKSCLHYVMNTELPWATTFASSVNGRWIPYFIDKVELAETKSSLSNGNTSCHFPFFAISTTSDRESSDRESQTLRPPKGSGDIQDRREIAR